MSASKAAATAAGRALLKAGARSLPVARGGGRRGSSKVARGLASVTLNQQQHRGAQGAMFMGVSACTAAVVGLAALLESEDLEGVLPAGMLEKLQQQGSSTALARIEEVREREIAQQKSTWSPRRELEKNTFVLAVAPRVFSCGSRAAAACRSMATHSTQLTSSRGEAWLPR